MALKDCCPGSVLLKKCDICAVIGKSEGAERYFKWPSVHADLVSPDDSVGNGKVRQVDGCAPVALGLHLVVKELPPVEDLVLLTCPVSDISAKRHVLVGVTNHVLLGFNRSIHGSFPWEFRIKDELGVIVHAMLIIFVLNNLAGAKLRNAVCLMVRHAKPRSVKGPDLCFLILKLIPDSAILPGSPERMILRQVQAQESLRQPEG